MDPNPPPIDWNGLVCRASARGGLLPVLLALPRAQWVERDPGDAETFLHYAARGDNVAAAVALLSSGLVDVNAVRTGRYGAAHMAVICRQPRMLEVLCAAGADVRARDNRGYAPMDCALATYCHECVRMLMANGVRLSSVLDRNCVFITPELEAFERGVLRCRAAVVALLRVKRAGGGGLVRWDRFLLAQLALELWATRCAPEWWGAASAERMESQWDPTLAAVDDDSG